MTILITGGAGFIGSHMAYCLLDAGKKNVIIDRLSTGNRWAVPRNSDLIVADISDQNVVERTIRQYGVTSIIHFAGSTSVVESVKDPLGYYLNNTINSQSLIEVAIRCGVSNIIFSSTAAVYGTSESNLISEDEHPRPQTPYGNSKLMTETMLRDVAKIHNLGVGILRYFNVAGADPQLRTGHSSAGAGHLIKVACEAALGKKPYLQIFGDDYPTADGTCIRDYIHVRDLVEAHLLLLNRLEAGGGSLTANCGYGTGVSVLDVIAMVKQVIGREFEVRITGRRPGDMGKVVADPSRLKAELGWLPKYNSLEAIITDSLRWEEKLRTIIT